MGLSLLRDPLRIALSLSIQGWVSTLLKDPWRIPLSEYSRMGPPTALCWSGILQLPMLVRHHPVAYELEAISPRLLCAKNSFRLPPWSPILWKALNFEDLSLSLPFDPWRKLDCSRASCTISFPYPFFKISQRFPNTLCLSVYMSVNSEILLQQIFSQLCNEFLADIHELQIIKPNKLFLSEFTSLQNHRTHKLLFFCHHKSAKSWNPQAPLLLWIHQSANHQTHKLLIFSEFISLSANHQTHKPLFLSEFISLQNHQIHKLLFFCEFISLQIIKPTNSSLLCIDHMQIISSNPQAPLLLCIQIIKPTTCSSSLNSSACKSWTSPALLRIYQLQIIKSTSSSSSLNSSVYKSWNSQDLLWTYQLQIIKSTKLFFQ